MLGKKLQRKRATLQDIYRLYQVAVRSPKLLTVLRELGCVTIDKNICEPLNDNLEVSFNQFLRKILITA